ncbi:MAG: AtpZ/AtpI family protein [Novosphingobium sp.]
MTDSSGQDGGSDLDRRIAEAQAKHTRGISSAEGRAETRGWAVGIEFVGTVLVSGFIGWGIDRWLELKTPWGLVGMLLLGFAAGTRRAMQTSASFDSDPANDRQD